MSVKLKHKPINFLLLVLTILSIVFFFDTGSGFWIIVAGCLIILMVVTLQKSVYVVRGTKKQP